MAQRSLRDALFAAAAAGFREKGYSATGVAAIDDFFAVAFPASSASPQSSARGLAGGRRDR
jgi:hypothetical protein